MSECETLTVRADEVLPGDVIEWLGVVTTSGMSQPYWRLTSTDVAPGCIAYLPPDMYVTVRRRPDAALVGDVTELLAQDGGRGRESVARGIITLVREYDAKARS